MDGDPVSEVLWHIKPSLTFETKNSLFCFVLFSKTDRVFVIHSSSFSFFAIYNKFWFPLWLSLSPTVTEEVRLSPH